MPLTPPNLRPTHIEIEHVTGVLDRVDARLSSTDKLVLAILARHADELGRCSIPVEIIADCAALDQRSVRRALSTLECLDFIHVTSGDIYYINSAAILGGHPPTLLDDVSPGAALLYEISVRYSAWRRFKGLSSGFSTESARRLLNPSIGRMQIDGRPVNIDDLVDELLDCGLWSEEGRDFEVHPCDLDYYAVAAGPA